MATTDGSPVRNQSNDFDTTPNGTARHTGLRIAIGILSIVVGILVVARPVDTLFFVAVLFGIQLVILGVVRIVLAASVSDLPRGLKILSVVLGILTIIAGVICFTRPQASLVILAILLAVGWIADGIADLARGFTGSGQGARGPTSSSLASCPSSPDSSSRSSPALRSRSSPRSRESLSSSSAPSPAYRRSWVDAAPADSRGQVPGQAPTPDSIRLERR